MRISQWKNKKGEVINLSDMVPEYMTNVVGMLERVRQRLEDEIGELTCYEMSAGPGNVFATQAKARIIGNQDRIKFIDIALKSFKAELRSRPLEA